MPTMLKAALAAIAFAAALNVNWGTFVAPEAPLAATALAVVGRPATPASVAGVSRRTTRRTLRRGAFVASLPQGCAPATVYGYAVQQCGNTYYQASGSGYVVVIFD